MNWNATINDNIYYGTAGQVARISNKGVTIICGDNKSILIKDVRFDGKELKSNNLLKTIKTRFKNPQLLNEEFVNYFILNSIILLSVLYYSIYYILFDSLFVHLNSFKSSKSTYSDKFEKLEKLSSI